MREMAAANPEVARYFESFCRSYLSSEASSSRPDTKLEEEEESKKKEEEEKGEEEGKAKVEGEKRNVDEDNFPLGKNSLH